MATTTQLGNLSAQELLALNARFERQPATAVIEWAVEQFHPRLCLTASMTDAVLFDLALPAEPSPELTSIAAHDVPVNPLLEQGYASIGCWPCTRPVGDGEHQRAGRWSGLDKTECGLHT